MGQYSKTSDGADQPVQLLAWHLPGDPDPHPHVKTFLRFNIGGTFGATGSWGSPATPTWLALVFMIGTP